MKRSSSLVTELLVPIIIGIFTSCVLMWIGFTIGMRVNAGRDANRIMYESTAHMRDKIDAWLTECSMVLDFTAIGALPKMLENPVNTEDLYEFYLAMADIHPDVDLVYGASAGRWDAPGGYMVFSDGWVNDDPYYDNTKQPWHAGAIAGRGETVFTDPYFDEYTGELVISIVKAINHQGRILGMAGVDLSMAALDEIANDTSIVDELRSYIVHSSGKFLSYPDNSFIMEKDFFEHNGLESFRYQALSGNSFYSASGKTIICSMPFSATDWTLISILPKNTIYQAGNRTGRISMVMVAFGMIGFTLVFRPIVKKKVKPIIEMSEELKEIAEGEGDLTRTVDLKSKNEVGELAHYFNLTILKIKNLVVNIKDEANVLSEVGNDLATNMNETAAAVNEITTNIQSIKSRVLNQSASVSETHATMEQVTVNINKLNGHVESQSHYVSQASAAIEEMVANIQSVTDTLVKNSANVKTLKEASEVGRNGLSEVATDIQEIARESEGLLEINSVMENIASQTNLLSMNAAIEAAHAGEAGKGFAVVADEIRKLAENSSEQSKTISSVLKKIKESIDKITQSTENVLNKFEAIDTNIRTVAEQEDVIRNAMEEQGEGSKQILEGVSNVTSITRQVRSSSNEMLIGAKEVIQESERLEKATQEITSGMNEMSTGAEHINLAVNHVNEISGKNREGINILIKEVSRFKVD
ncbi:MAG: methyl-accepting chemotaxis protein [Treponema sp.]|nr:methyl-accepting chemotaxis protein [Treponema sp.]